ncbi:hypothetical protein P152DRAFT_221577 [Eremomyces bilateralis CBS 781.70]|uniref:2-methoxy-6-polyprenyl-1,4-benzoquinol methylase, mitochondrial n=1 Tax=Eremomyces bilateralis CBS 781.70 TaxID=1392243 RepID=A0A6G1FRR7_9PEZI|nr:uncharacterized protein P152DRAFT_221577 [Eremomyces bilateralis CBS 781.70]KAF1808428.1 hypothetical protein P152DRAFT_221577 [Eremomyces bilateralis CBS 781.70]
MSRSPYSSAGRLCFRCLRASKQSRSTRSFASTASANQPPAASPRPSSNDAAPADTTHFGFQTIAESMKESRVGAVFSSVAGNYDAMNDFMSLGIHRLWKDHFVRSLDPGHPSSISPSTPSSGWKILDVAGGTGDIAFRMLDHATTIHNDTSTSVLVADINPDMLNEGKKRALQTAYARSGRLEFMEANAESIPSIPSNSIDLYTVAFGIRNFTHKDAALREAFRILKPGGIFACLEFTPRLSNPLLNAVYKRWSFGAIPIIGQLVAGDRDSYQYLVESIERFPSQDEWRGMIEDAGFVTPQTAWEDLNGGIAAIHKGMKPLR